MSDLIHPKYRKLSQINSALSTLGAPVHRPMTDEELMAIWTRTPERQAYIDTVLAELHEVLEYIKGLQDQVSTLQRNPIIKSQTADTQMLLLSEIKHLLS